MMTMRTQGVPLRDGGTLQECYKILLYWTLCIRRGLLWNNARRLVPQGLQLCRGCIFQRFFQ